MTTDVHLAVAIGDAIAASLRNGQPYTVIRFLDEQTTEPTGSYYAVTVDQLTNPRAPLGPHRVLTPAFSATIGHCGGLSVVNGGVR